MNEPRKEMEVTEREATEEKYSNEPAERADGTRMWCRDGKLHREDGPAIEWADGTREWRLDGLLHRDDGPAIEYADGSREWYRNGKETTTEEGI